MKDSEMLLIGLGAAVLLGGVAFGKLSKPLDTVATGASNNLNNITQPVGSVIYEVGQTLPWYRNTVTNVGSWFGSWFQ